VQEQTFAGATGATAGSYPPERRLSAGQLAGYLDRRAFAVIGSCRPDGRPHAAMSSYVRQGREFWLPTVGGSVRERNVRSQPWLTMTIAMRPWTPGSGVRAVDRPSRAGPRPATDQPTDGGGKGHGRGRRERSCRPLPPSDLPFQDAYAVSPSPSSPGSSPASGVPRASAVRWFAAVAWPLMQWA